MFLSVMMSGVFVPVAILAMAMAMIVNMMMSDVIAVWMRCDDRFSGASGNEQNRNCGCSNFDHVSSPFFGSAPILQPE